MADIILLHNSVFSTNIRMLSDYITHHNNSSYALIDPPLLCESMMGETVVSDRRQRTHQAYYWTRLLLDSKYCLR